MRQSPQKANRPRASGQVQLSHFERLRVELIQLKAITSVHKAIEARDARLDLACWDWTSLQDWTPQALETLTWVCLPWVLKRSAEGGTNFVLVCGGQFLQSLRSLLPEDAEIPAVVIDSKLREPRILQMAAVHSTAMAFAGTTLTADSVQRLLADAEAMGRPVENTISTSVGSASRPRSRSGPKAA